MNNLPKTKHAINGPAYAGHVLHLVGGMSPAFDVELILVRQKLKAF